MKNNLEDLVREYGNVPAVGPGRCRKDVMADITALITENVEADAYNIACELMEEGWRERAKRGVEIGTQGSLCDGISWIFDRVKKLEAAKNLPADQPWRVGEFWSSATPGKKVLCLAEGADIVEWAKRADFIRWVSP